MYLCEMRDLGCSRESRLNFTEIFTINRLRHRCGAVEGRAFSGTVVAVLEIPALDHYWMRSVSPLLFLLLLLFFRLQLDNSLDCCSVSRLFFATLWAAACQASLSFSISWRLLKLMSIESVKPSNPLLLCHVIYFIPSLFLTAGPSLPCWRFSSCAECGLLSSCSAQASHCRDFSCCEAQALGCLGFSSRGAQALGHRLNSCGMWA